MHELDVTPYWIDSAPMPRFPAVTEPLQVDVIVVGGGITGITAAYLLKKAGHTVALLERDRCARVDTGHTTAHLTCVTDARLTELASDFNEEVARAVWDAGAAATDQIVNLISAEDIGCDFKWVPGFLHEPADAPEGAAVAGLKKEAELANKLGISAEYLEAIPVFQRAGVRFPHQAIFHPRKYLAGLLRTIAGGGSHVFEHSAVEEVIDHPLAVRVGGVMIRGQYLVLATHNPLQGNKGTLAAALFQNKLALYQSYAVGAAIPHDIFPTASFWDTGDPYNYLRVERRRDHDYAIFGGEDHKTGQAEDTREVYRRIEKRLLALVPEAKIDHRWSGQVIETPDGLPYIGETAERQFAATGFAGNGLTFGTLGAMMAVDAVAGRKNPWRELFDPNRKTISATWQLLKENKDYPYYLVRNFLAKAEGHSLGAVKRGQGKILELDGHRVAAYRDADGKVSLCSPVCTHLQCIVGWNNAEQTWDCPCHGSRFKPTGEVISGPAEAPLARLDAHGKPVE